MAKTITNRLKTVLDSIISPNQSAFVSRRLIIDNVIVGFESIHALNQRRKGKVGYAAIKLDMSKAYDRVEWPFIRRIMFKMGFEESWIRIMYDNVRQS